jgi:simple sugar transport system permease protein
VKRSLFARVLTRPEIGALAAAIAIFIFFFAIAPPFRTLPSFATVLYASSTIGIVAVGVALLMIGGSSTCPPVSRGHRRAVRGHAVLPAVAEHVGRGDRRLARRLAIGFVNGYLVVRTGIPSFLITLSTFFMLRASTWGATKAVTGTVATANVAQLDGFLAAKAVFAADIPLGFITVKVTVLWWLLFVAIGTWILLRTKDRQLDLRRRRQRRLRPRVGVPVPRVKIGLFMGVAFLAGSTACTCCSTSPRCSPGWASATSSSTSSPRSSAAACSPAATARSSARRSARSSSA